MTCCEDEPRYQLCKVCGAKDCDCTMKDLRNFQAGAASRDAEIAELNNQLDLIRLATPALDSIGVAAPSPRVLMEKYRQVLQERHGAEIAELVEANRIACEDLAEQQNLRVAYGEQVAELVAALELLSKYIAYNGDDWVQRTALEALAKVRKPCANN